MILLPATGSGSRGTGAAVAASLLLFPLTVAASVAVTTIAKRHRGRS